MKTTSESDTRLQPSPTAGPLTAATTGTRHRSMLRTSRLPVSIVRRRSAGSSAEVPQVAEVAAGGERPAVAGDDHGARFGVVVDLREQVGEALVQVVVDRVQVVGPVEADDADRAVGLDRDLVGNVVHGGVLSPGRRRRGQEVGSPRMRVAMMFFWIWDVPPITLWARLYR